MVFIYNFLGPFDFFLLIDWSVCIYYFLGLVCLWKKWMYNRRIFIVRSLLDHRKIHEVNFDVFIWGYSIQNMLEIEVDRSSKQISSILIYNFRGNIFHLFSYYMIYRRTCVLCIFERVLDHRLSFDSLLCD